MSLHVTWEQYHRLIEQLALKVHESDFRFNQIICIARGGLRVGDVLSRIFESPLAILSTHSYASGGGTIRGELVIAEHMTMTAPGLALTISRVASMPLLNGMTMSMVVRSGLSSLNFSTASRPLAASPTTSKPPPAKMSLIMLRMKIASSTMRTRFAILESSG